MNFGLLFEMQRPFEGNDVDWNSLYRDTLDECELADQVGFHNLWFVEHHFLMGFSGSPCPEVMLGALSQRHRGRDHIDPLQQNVEIRGLQPVAVGEAVEPRLVTG